MTDDLIQRATKVAKPRRIRDRRVGDVGAALVTDAGNVYVGVCIDLPSGTGFCAEASAIAAMVSAGEFKIRRIAAVWKDENGVAYVVSPCGRCREFIRQIDDGNLDTEVILGPTKTVTLRDLLPHAKLSTPVEPWVGG